MLKDFIKKMTEWALEKEEEAAKKIVKSYLSKLKINLRF